MAKQGSLLEKNVERIFSLAGFETARNVKRESYEIDVLATHRNLKIAIECKERDNGPLTVRNLIHEWAGKKRYINVDKVLIVIYGPSVSSKDMELAGKEEIEIWDSDKFEKYLDLSHELKEKSLPLILKDLGITTKEVEELNRKIESDIKKKKEELDRQVDILYNEIPAKRREKIEYALEKLIEEGKDSIDGFVTFTEKKGIFSSKKEYHSIDVSSSGNHFRIEVQSLRNLIDVLAENSIKVYYDKELEEEREQLSKSLSVSLKQNGKGFIDAINSLEKQTKPLMPLYTIFDEIYCQKEDKKTIVVLIELFFRYCAHLNENYDVNIEYALDKDEDDNIKAQGTKRNDVIQKAVFNDGVLAECIFCQSKFKVDSNDMPEKGEKIKKKCPECGAIFSMSVPDSEYVCSGCKTSFNNLKEKMEHFDVCKKVKERTMMCKYCRKKYVLDDSEFQELNFKGILKTDCPSCKKTNLLKK